MLEVLDFGKIIYNIFTQIYAKSHSYFVLLSWSTNISPSSLILHTDLRTTSDWGLFWILRVICPLIVSFMSLSWKSCPYFSSCFPIILLHFQSLPFLNFFYLLFFLQVSFLPIPCVGISQKFQLLKVESCNSVGGAILAGNRWCMLLAPC
jgi:hypothetical protein